MVPISCHSTVISEIPLYSPQEGIGSSNRELKDFDAREEPPDQRRDGMTIHFELLFEQPTFDLGFSAGLIASGDLSVGEVKLKANTALSDWLKHSERNLSETDGIEFFFAGRMLENDARSCRDAALSSGAVILARVPPDAGESSHRTNETTQYRGASTQETKSQDLVMDSNHPGPSKMRGIAPTTPKSVPPHMGAKEVIYFKDCLGREWRFPFRTCSTWDVSPKIPMWLTTCQRLLIAIVVDDE